MASAGKTGVDDKSAARKLDFSGLCVPFAFGDAPIPRWLCSRYLPEIPGGLITNWMGDSLQPGSLVLDPFGASPASLVELARHGCAVVTCMLNPILRLTLEGSCHNFTQPEVQTIVDELGSSLKETSRFDEYIQGLYLTVCTACGQLVQADEYIWERGGRYPAQVVYDCPSCHSHQERDTNTGDKEILDRITRTPLFRMIAIDRITSKDPALKQDAEELVNAHSPRALYILVSLFSRLDALHLQRQKKALLNALLVNVLDSANTLWPLEHAEFRPYLLNTPPRYREINLWKRLTNFAKEPSTIEGRLRLKHYPDLPVPGEICIYPGRVKDLLQSGEDVRFDAVSTVIPRPNQAFWKLSAAWSTWLLEREESRSFAGMIARDRYDWTWHAHALEGVFQSVKASGKVSGEWHAVMAGVEPAFISSVIPSAQKSGWKLSAFAMRHEDKIVELKWQPEKPGNSLSRASQIDIEKAAMNYLTYKGEPADYLEMTCASLLHLAQADLSVEEQDGISIQSQLKVGFSNPMKFIHLGPGGQTLESGSWWLGSHPAGNQTISDLLELEIIQLLNTTTGITSQIAEKQFRKLFPAALGGMEDYITHLLSSYASRQPGKDAIWVVNDKEKESSRLEVVKKLSSRVKALGHKLHFHVEGDQPICWMDESKTPIYRLYIYYHTAFIGELWHLPQKEGKAILVLPASRLDLLAYKQKELPAMNQLLSSGWHIVKFRLMSRLVENPYITRDKLEELLKTDPVENDPDQLFLF